MKKYISWLILVGCLFSLLIGCSSQGYKDGVYRAEASEYYHGWKESVEITIVGGNIDKVSWDAVSNDPNIPIGKKQYSKSGLYGMLVGAAIDEWCDQAKAAEDYILAYGLDFSVDDGGYTDAITGCTVQVDTLAILAKKCLEQAQK